jgi:hypothetical protein
MCRLAACRAAEEKSMQTAEHEQSSTFSKPVTWEAVRASGIALIRLPGVDVATLPLRVTCAVGLAERPGGEPCVRIDYFVEALWQPSGGSAGWDDITSRDLRPEDDATARALFAETDEEACVIDAAIERMLRPEPFVARARAGAGEPATLGAMP